VIDLQRLKLAEEKSRLSIQKAEHEVAINAMKAKQAEAELNTYHIQAPFKGTVSRVLRSRGEAVKQGDPILEVVNTDTVHVDGKVIDRDIWRVKVGCPVTVVLDIKGADLDVEKQVFHGKIGFVDSVADEASAETRVWAEVPNPGNVLRPGFLSTMTILPSQPDETHARSGTRRPASLNTKIAVRQELRAP
jgi:membrane fusion protein (multidrug efflux system)